MSQARKRETVSTKGWFLAWLTLRPSKWRRCVPPKCLLAFNGICDNLKSYKTLLHCGSWDPDDFYGLEFLNAYKGNGSLNKVF
jgi:hypothetical protein